MSNNQDLTTSEPSAGIATNSSDVLITIANNNPNAVTSTPEANNNDSDPNNSSSGSQRSLNRLFPFRFSRDILLNNVFQEIRPLVQNTSSANTPFSSWITRNVQSDEHSTQTPTENARTLDVESTGTTDNVNLPSTSSYARQNSAPTRIITDSEEMGIASINQSRISLPGIQHQSTDSAESDPNGNANGNEQEQTIGQIPEARAFINTVSKYFPYVCILFAKSCYDHLDGILDIFALFVVFAHSNFTLKQEITKQGQRRFLYLIRELIYIVIVVTIIGFILEKKPVSLFFAPIKFPTEEKTLALKDLLFSVCITDLILKLVTVAFKIVFTMLPRKAVEFKNRGRVYLLIEAISQLYRALVPIQLWLMYLLESYIGTEKIMGVILSAAYIVAKGSDILQRVKFLKRSFIKFLQKTSFGSTPTKEQIQAAGGTCPICHDNYQDPVILNECNHIFCELCLLGWLDRENNTCPLCRAKIDQDNPGYRDGSTSFFLQLY